MSVCIIDYEDELLTCWLQAWAFVDQSQSEDKVTINRGMTQWRRAKGDGLGSWRSGYTPEESVWLHQLFFNYWCHPKTRESLFTQKRKCPDLLCVKYNVEQKEIIVEFSHLLEETEQKLRVCIVTVLSIQNTIMDKYIHKTRNPVFSPQTL